MKLGKLYRLKRNHSLGSECYKYNWRLICEIGQDKGVKEINCEKETFMFLEKTVVSNHDVHIFLDNTGTVVCLSFGLEDADFIELDYGNTK